LKEDESRQAAEDANTTSNEKIETLESRKPSRNQQIVIIKDQHPMKVARFFVRTVCFASAGCHGSEFHQLNNIYQYIS